VGHPGTRNDKRIVRTDTTVMDLLEGNGWLNFKTWCSAGENGTRKLHRGVYLICDGGYHRWPVLINPYKDTIPGSAIMKFIAKLESIRKDVEGVFGILKKRFKFLKNFNVLQTQECVRPLLYHTQHST
jgi:Plant transposon protein